ncbi:MAG: rod shape-determining protein MreC [Verrucomicrobia bacterium]|nr:rod shape-determining protein MreC [Verrucomicrobiota bacterium]
MNRLGVIALAIFLIGTGIVLSLPPATQKRLAAAVQNVVAPLFKAGSDAKNRVEAYATGVKTLAELEKENALLKGENQRLSESAQLLRGLEEENAKLRAALDFKQRSKFRLVPARVIARESATWWTQILIDRGEQDGIEPDMPVLTEAGVVGKTTTVAKRSAAVLLIADENCKVAVSIEGAKEQGILSGARTSTSQSPELTIRFLPKTVEMKPGNKVYSSGVSGGVFPSGLLIGTVLESPKARELDAQVRVAPAVDLARLDNVFVIRTESAPVRPE